MAKSPFFSVVMPVYNVEKYLERAINSVLNQTFDDFEFILVDDCSPDSSGKICDDYAKKDSRVRVLHLNTNGGLSNARNQGIDLASGAFIFFMDSDDYIENFLFMRAHQTLNKYHSQVLIFGLVEDYYDNSGKLRYTRKIEPQTQNYFTVDSLRDAVIQLEEKTLYGYAWNKFYDLNYLLEKNIKFKSITLIEDITFNIEFFMEITRLSVLGICPYHYEKRQENSLTNKFVPNYYDLHRQRVQMLFNQYDNWHKLSENIKKSIGNIYFRYIISTLQRNCDPRANLNHSKRKQWLQKLYDSPLYKNLKRFIHPAGLIAEIIGHLIISENTELCLFCAKTIYITKNKFPILFSKLKQSR